MNTIQYNLMWNRIEYYYNIIIYWFISSAIYWLIMRFIFYWIEILWTFNALLYFNSLYDNWEYLHVL